MGRTFVVVTYELAETIIEVLLGCCSKLFKPGISFAESSRISFFPHRMYEQLWEMAPYHRYLYISFSLRVCI